MPASDSPDGPLTLGALLGRLSPVVLELVASPLGVDVPVERAVIAGATDDIELAAGDVVLLVGADPVGDACAAAIERAGAARAASVVLKAGPEHHLPLRSLAEIHGVAVVTAPTSADWGQVFTLLRTVSNSSAIDHLDHAPADLFALANAIAGAVGGATTIEDRQLRVVAYSNLDQPIDAVRRDSILGRSVPSYVMERDDIAVMYRKMWADTEVVHLPAQEGERVRARMGAPVRAADEVIGTIWVVEGDRPFEASAERALRDSTPIAAVHLLQHQAAADVARRHRTDAVRDALEGRAVERLGFAAGQRVTVVAFGARRGVIGAGDAAADVMRQHRLLDLVAFQVEMFDAHGVAVTSGDTVLAIVPEPSEAGRRRLRELVADVARRAGHALKADVCAGVGSAGGVDGLVHSRWEAEQALAVAIDAEGPGSGATVRSIDVVRSTVAMRRVRELLAGDERSRTPHLEVLARHDAELHTDHLATLGAYLDAFGDVSTAAASLDIHANTMRYRLKRIVDLLAVDFTDPVERFVIELQWRIR